jgi:hypothetical protein
VLTKRLKVTLALLSRKMISVARWFIFKTKIPIWVNFGGSWNEKGCNIL